MEQVERRTKQEVKVMEQAERGKQVEMKDFGKVKARQTGGNEGFWEGGIQDA